MLIVEAPDIDDLYDTLKENDNSFIIIDQNEEKVPYIFWKKIIKMMMDCSYESIIFQYSQMILQYHLSLTL